MQCGLGSYGKRNHVTINPLHIGVELRSIVGPFEGLDQKNEGYLSTFVVKQSELTVEIGMCLGPSR